MADSAWRKNLRDTILLDPLITLHGNVKDLFFLDDAKRQFLPASLSQSRYAPFPTWLALELIEMQFPVVSIFDSVDGAVFPTQQMANRFRELATRTRSSPAADVDSPSAPSNQGPQLPRSDPAPQTPAQTSPWMVKLDTQQTPEDFFRTLYASVFKQSETPVAVICQFTDRYLSFSDRQNDDEKRLSILIQKAAMEIACNRQTNPIQSRIFLLFDLEGAIPQEISVQAPFSRTLRIPNPSLEDREHFFRNNFDQFYHGSSDPILPESHAQDLRDLANLSDGLNTQDLLSLIALSNEETLGLAGDEFKSLLDRFKFGTRHNAWKKIKDETLRNAKQSLQARVKGQDQVIDQVVPTLIRAKLGLTELSNKRYSTKPRGIFFFVGPTGVGKTELSKAIAELIFGDERALTRFDMSEYSEEHQQARLIGAPPGYVGFDQGGQLPNAIMERPFSVVLFDEIEKMHGRILDKFLQILDEGRLTDGMGRTVYFSEAIIVFTSNLGTAPKRQSPMQSGGVELQLNVANATSTQDVYTRLAERPYSELCRHFRGEVKDFFVNQLGRPEILNRIGEENILVFDFLKNETVKDAIIEKQVEDLSRYLAEKFQIAVNLTPTFRKVLLVHPSGFERNGARGVRNLLSHLVLNHIAMEVFEEPAARKGKTFIVDYADKSTAIGEGFEFDSAKVKHRWG